MQAIPYKSWTLDAAHVTSSVHVSTPEQSERSLVSTPEQPERSLVSTLASDIQKLVAENAVIVVGRRGCCMTHVVTRLLLGHGVNPTIYDVDEDDEAAVVIELRKMMTIVAGDESVIENWPQFPVVFVGGKMFGGLDKVMATHISGELVPVLKQAGALWL